MKIQNQSHSPYENRCYHFKPNQILQFNSHEYRLMNKNHTPQDTDPLAPNRTEPLTPPLSTYISQHGGK